MMIRTVIAGTVLLALMLPRPRLEAQLQAVLDGPTGPSPYEVVRGWHQPFAAPGFAFGGNSGVFAESPDRIFVAQRGEFRLPEPLPPGYAGFAGSLKMNVLTLVDRRVWKNCLYTLDRNGRVKERWTQWDHLCEGSSGPGPHRVRISPYDPERRETLIPVHAGRRGHPILLPWRRAAEVEALPPDRGINSLVSAGKAVEVEVPYAGIGEDLDTPEDYRRLG